MYKEDIAFRQQTCFDTSSSSNETKGQQLGHSSGKSSPSPPRMILKSCKTPSHEYHYGSVPNAALVPQTDLQPRNQQGRRRRNSSSSTNSSGTRRPGLRCSFVNYILPLDRDLSLLFSFSSVWQTQ